MINMKKTAIAAALGFSMVSGASQAAINNFNFNGVFVMFNGSATTFDPASTTYQMDSGNGTLGVGDPVTGTMSMSDVSGAGSATMVGSLPFYASPWTATGISLQASGPGAVTAQMMFNWGAATSATVLGTDWSLAGAVSGDGTGTCGLTNCNIGVTVGFTMMPGANPGEYTVATVSTSMPSGPFAGRQAAFAGTATWTGQTAETVVPVPAAAWLLGSGLLGLVGVARRKAA